MFTDIEGSTRLHQRLGESFATLIAEHDLLLGGLIAGHGGSVVTSMGDGLFAAFSDAEEAVAAAAEIQDAVAAHAWPALTELRVRVGLHCGQAAPRNGNYIALAVHQAARVSAAAYGGQVLATADVVEAADCRERVADLGAYLLKDFDDPVVLFAVPAASGAGPVWSGTRATPAAAHNVPAVRTSFVGREGELAELCEILGVGERLVSIIGPGGIGKTRLAFEAVKAIARSFRDGAWVVLLSNTAAGDEIEEVLLATLGIPSSGAPARDTLLAALAHRHTLLVLDNTEQVSEQVADLVRHILSKCEMVSFLVTSRQPLAIDGEVEWRLAPLAVDGGSGEGAVELFVQGALTRNPRLGVEALDRDLIAQVCTQLDGLPLAVELAAARLKHMSLVDLAARLHERLQTQPVTGRTLDPRQRTLRDLVDWSYQLLTPLAQRVLRRMAVLRAPASLATVEAISDQPDTVADGLGELVEKSLVSFDDDADAPYRMLVTIRDFALRRLDEDAEEAADARRRHADRMVDLAAAIDGHLDGPDPRRWLARSAALHDDMAAAMAFAEGAGDGEGVAGLAVHHGRSLRRLGRAREAQAWALRASPLPCSQATRVAVLAATALNGGLVGDPEQAVTAGFEALAVAVSLKNDQLAAKAALSLWDALERLGRREEAKTLAERFLTGAISVSCAIGLVTCLGAAAHLDGSLDVAIGHYRAAVELSTWGGEVQSRPVNLANLGDAFRQIGDIAAAEAVLRDALALPVNELDRPFVYLQMAELSRVRGDERGAGRWAADACRLARDHGSIQLLAMIEATGLLDDASPDRAATLAP